MSMGESGSIFVKSNYYRYKTNQKPLAFEISFEVHAAANLLEKNFRLKLPHKTFKSYLRFIQLYFSILRNKKKMKQELEVVIRSFEQRLRLNGDL